MRKVVPGPVTKRLMEKFAAELANGIERLDDWEPDMIWDQVPFEESDEDCGSEF